MISDKMTEAINKQINAELYSAYLYLGMSADAENKGYKGTSHWLSVQAQEEISHAMKFYQYLLSQGAKAEFLAIEKPPAEYASISEIFEKTLAHEQLVTSLINGLVDIAVEEKDHASQIMLQWFVSEQVEEEENASDILSQLKMVGDHGGGVFLIDKEIGARVPLVTMPVAGE